jgi:uncharacterized protein
MATSPITLEALRRYAVARTFFAPVSLPAAMERLGFVQADPIRAPARAQDLTLRHRVKGYVAGDLEKRYAEVGVEEDFFVNYGFLPRGKQALMHPRTGLPWAEGRKAMADAVLDFVRDRGVVHPREVDRHFSYGRVRNWFGGSTNAGTKLLDEMHFRGLLRVTGRVSGTRTYAVVDHLPDTMADPEERMDALVDVIVQKYAPLPELSLRELIRNLRGGAPQWEAQRPAAFVRAKARLASAVVGGVTWYWPTGESPGAKRHAAVALNDTVRLLAPFDPLVWDRRRFELFWGWAYRFEAYTPAAKRVRGYYALPLLWRDQVIGWGNLAIKAGKLEAVLGYITGKAPADRAFHTALDEELERMRRFLAAD